MSGYIAEQYLEKYQGKRKLAALGLALDLAEDDKANFKRGYEVAAAAIAAGVTLDLSIADVENLTSLLKEYAEDV